MIKLSTNFVPCDGPLDAEICFVGEAPGREEDEHRLPFIGSAGILFNKCLKSAGLLRSQVLVWNVFQQRPPGNDAGYFFQDKSRTRLTWEGQEHVERLRVWLEKLLEMRRRIGKGPRILVALGETAVFQLAGKQKISKWRGSVVPCTLVEGFKVYLMFHPSYVNRLVNEPSEQLQGEKKRQKANALPLFLRDLARVKMQSESINLPYMTREFVICQSSGEALERLGGISDGETVAVDIESIKTDRGTLLWCVGFAPRPDYAFTVPFLRSGRSCWSSYEEAQVLRGISSLFLNPRVTKVFHHEGFDLSILGRYYGLRVATGSVADTMWCFQATYPYVLKGLAALASIYTWEPYYKEDGKWWDGRRISDEAEFLYNCKDCAVTREIWPLVSSDAKKLGTWGNYQRHMKVLPSLLRMMIRGVRFDEEARRGLIKDFSGRMAGTRVHIGEIVGQELNPGSPSQLSRFLYGYLGLPVQYHIRTKKPTTDKDALNRLAKKFPQHKVLKEILEFKKLEKLVEQYGEFTPEDDGRIRTSYSFVTTFRLSSSESHFGGGGNLQNIPVKGDEGKMVRRLFKADEGLVLLASDLEQAEAREVAWDSGNLELIEAFLDKSVDVHWRNTCKIFQLPKDLVYRKETHRQDVYKPKIIGIEFTLYALRQIGKTVQYAGQYGMGPGMLQTILAREGVFLELSVCKVLLYSVVNSDPFLVNWQGQIRNEIRATRTLINAFGDKREFQGRLSDMNTYKSGYAWKPQSNVGRIMELGIQAIHEKIVDYEPLLNVHDEVVGQCREKDVLRIAKEMRPLLEIPHMVGGRELKIPCAFKVGPSWGELKEVEL
jgi:uracil-DNA glycosylase family 4